MFYEQLPIDLTHSTSVTRQCLIESLDRTAFVITNTRPPSALLTRCLIVDQTGSMSPLMGKRVLRSQPQSWTVAIVDRTANLKLAAKEVLCSRTFFSGKGSYAPNCIIVNEFVEHNFIGLLCEEASMADNYHGPEKGHGAAPISHTASERNSDTKGQTVLLNAQGFRLIKICERSDEYPSYFIKADMLQS